MLIAEANPHRVLSDTLMLNVCIMMCLLCAPEIYCSFPFCGFTCFFIHLHLYVCVCVFSYVGWKQLPRMPSLAAKIVEFFALYSEKLHFQKTMLLWLAEWRGRSLGLCVTAMAPPFQLSLHAAGTRKKNRSEMRGEKNRGTEWESSRWDDIMCTAAKLQQHWNKRVTFTHSHATDTQNLHLLLNVYSSTHTHSSLGSQVPIVGKGIYWISALIYSPVLSPSKKSFSL